jgi:hypothetical protein
MHKMRESATKEVICMRKLKARIRALEGALLHADAASSLEIIEELLGAGFEEFGTTGGFPPGSK